jgi:CRISPR-associated endonuclease/helicase Cas3
MTELSVNGFADFFEALWDYRPFAWQGDLAERVILNMEQPWPEAIKLPTAAGKTACIDIAVYALAACAEGHQRAPRRIFFVVDRRIIVDEAFERARRMARKLREADNGIVREVADTLRRLAGGDNPLMCFQLRGGMYRSDAWARSPLQPAIIATTVDQLGSRLLFRAYGRSSKAWPIQAGLAANDALILLDEAHCSQPFMETLHSVRKYRQWADEPLPGVFHVSIMSATPPEAQDIFQDTSQEPETEGHPLGDRQMATKNTYLELSKASGKKAREQLALELVEHVEGLVNGEPVAAVVFANYVATAREAYRLLKAKHGENAILLTGRMRPIDKDDTITERLYKFDLSSGRSKERRLTAPVFVVATQTLEVGADLDFDVLVTECASLDALRQRFGRLNRMGRKIESHAAILMRSDLERSSADDPVYGESLSRTWQWMNEQADEDRKINMGIAALAERLPEGEELALLNAPTDNAPVMLPAHVDCWVQTQPEPVPTPDVSVFLHGPGRTSADVHVCWRSDIELDSQAALEASLDVLSQCPPSAAESLPVPIWVMRRWVNGREALAEAVSDVEGITTGSKEDENGNDRPAGNRRVIRWRGRDEAEVIADSWMIRPGDVIIIPAREEGWGTLGDLPHTADTLPVLDWGDRAYAAARGKAILRLHPAVIAMWPESASKSMLLELVKNAKVAWEEDMEGFVLSLREAMAFLSGDDAAPAWLRRIAANLYRRPSVVKQSMTLHPLGQGVIVKGRDRLDPQADELHGGEVDWFTDEDDASASGTVNESLESHLAGVASLAKRFAAACVLPDHLVDALKWAGQLHDTGKADPRFQALLRGGNPWARGELLAKSDGMPQGSLAYTRARRAAGYPENGRHELLSVRLAESIEHLFPADSGLRDLVLHLIESHHGHCRPFAPVVDDPAPVEVLVHLNGSCLSARSDTRLERLDSGVSERFWRLTRRYGWWGLAWLEAILRLSDHRRSEWEEDQRRKYNE